MRVVLTGLWENERRVSSLVRSLSYGDLPSSQAVENGTTYEYNRTNVGYANDGFNK